MNSILYFPDRLELTEDSIYECPRCYAGEADFIKTSKETWICRRCWYKNHKDFYIVKSKL